MSDRTAVLLEDVVKSYHLDEHRALTLGSLFGLARSSGKGEPSGGDFLALNGVSLSIRQGERVGIVGRNGAGKTTLLKLLCGNFAPTSGSVRVEGQVQALMTMGTGFHPEHTGRRNAQMSLKYNGLAPAEEAAALEDVEKFCELGPFFDQPFKVYSLGMQARLMFAVATAVKPEILIIDEVLGAGDSYFVAKSKLRMERLVRSGCTMILVSHSTAQILELCERVIWLDSGKVRMDGEAFLVVKTYEEHMHGSITGIQQTVQLADEAFCEDGRRSTESNPSLPSVIPARDLRLPEAVQLQAPSFLPHAQRPLLPALREVEPFALNFQAPGGISRWDSKPGVKICGFSVVTEKGITNELVSFRPAAFVVTIAAEITGTYDLRYGIALHDFSGNCLTRIFSPRDTFELRAGFRREIRMLLNPNQFGPGDYVVGISVHDYGRLEDLNTVGRYDLLSRSFVIRISLPDSLNALSSAVLHTAEWGFSTV